MIKRVEKTEQQWQQELDPETFAVARKGGTERAFTGRYYEHHDPGIYRCACCGTELFDSEAKYESGSGWPSFTRPADPTHVNTREDVSHGMRRIEILCAACDAHLGHVFPDGPQAEGGLRFCVNSASLRFDDREE